jgi:hypothetical protein
VVPDPDRIVGGLHEALAELVRAAAGERTAEAR